MVADTFEAPVSVEIEEFLDALNLLDEAREQFDRLLPEGLQAKDSVTVNATVQTEDARDHLDDELSPDDLAIDLRDLREGLEAALAGDRNMAMILLGRCFDDVDAGGSARRIIEETCLGSRAAGHPELPLTIAA